MPTHRLPSFFLTPQLLPHSIPDCHLMPSSCSAAGDNNGSLYQPPCGQLTDRAPLLCSDHIQHNITYLMYLYYLCHTSLTYSYLTYPNPSGDTSGLHGWLPCRQTNSTAQPAPLTFLQTLCLAANLSQTWSDALLFPNLQFAREQILHLLLTCSLGAASPAC